MVNNNYNGAGFNTDQCKNVNFYNITFSDNIMNLNGGGLYIYTTY